MYLVGEKWRGLQITSMRGFDTYERAKETANRLCDLNEGELVLFQGCTEARRKYRSKHVFIWELSETDEPKLIKSKQWFEEEEKK